MLFSSKLNENDSASPTMLILPVMIIEAILLWQVYVKKSA